MSAVIAYCEIFDWDRCDWFCNICDRPLDGTSPYPEHAPTEFAGLELVECYAEPRHPHTFMYAQDGGYSAPCGYCTTAAVAEAHKNCEHAHHQAWRRWRVTDRAVSVLHRINLVIGSRWSNCNGRGTCVSGITWRWSR